MKIQPLYDLQSEINRLFVAGSKFSKDDPRLIKHIPVFQKMGERIPVFQKIATELQTLVSSAAAESAQQLMEVSNLLYAVLYTQGENIASDVSAEKMEQVPAIPLSEVNTRFSYLQLKPVIEALAVSKSGRLEVLKEAQEARMFKDVRTFAYLNDALSDKYSELAEFVNDHIIPSIGNAIEPILFAQFKLEDKSDQVRRLKALITLNSNKIDTLIARIFEQSLPNLQTEAISYLKQYPKNEDFIIQLVNDKNKGVRGAAYNALVNYNTPKSIQTLIDLFAKSSKKSNQDLSDAIARIPTKDKAHIHILLDQLNSSLEQIVANADKEKELTKSAEQFYYSVSSLANKDTPEVHAFIEAFVKNDDYLKIIKKAKLNYYNSGAYFTDTILDVVDTWNQDDVIAFYEKMHEEKKKSIWKESLLDRYAVKGFLYYTPEHYYQVFSDLFKQDKILLGSLLTYQNYEDRVVSYIDVNLKDNKSLDIKWVDLIKEKIYASKKLSGENQKQLKIACLIAPESDKKLNQLLVSLFQKEDYHFVVEFAGIMIGRGIPNIYDEILSHIKKLDWKKSSWNYYRLAYMPIWKHFPKSYLPAFQELALQYDNNTLNDIVNKMEESIVS